MRHWIRLYLALISGCGLLVLGAFGVSRAQPLERGALGLFACDQPCWEGIMPGVTRDSEALDVLVARGYLSDRPALFQRGRMALYLPVRDHPTVCQVAVNLMGGVVISVAVNFCRGQEARVGDVLLALGLPRTYGIFSTNIAEFGAGSVRALGQWNSPHAPVADLIARGQPQLDRFPWIGFAPLWRQCQEIGRAWLGCVGVLRR